ncbi:MAG TPA: hypothetical protein PKC49_02395 [Phycisphaerae bacterium]|nr:hypothetical protein [Phycisphaerae bacterium]
MPLVAGIDEAGYGPTLGPLVVAASLWRVPPQHAQADLWKLLRSCVGRADSRGDALLRIDDSKRVFDRKRGIGSLERPVLACARAAGLPCQTLRELRAALGCPSDLDTALPWEAAADPALPLDPVHGAYQAIAGRLAAECRRAGVACAGLMARTVSPRRFNQRVAQTDNKASVLLEHVLDLLAASARAADDEELHLYVDHLGGRTNYRDLLQALFPGAGLRELEVSPSRSAYELRARAAPWRITFVVEADQAFLPVALASMLAKYLREVLMEHFNAYWKRLVPGLRPTAGYYQDARRFLEDIETARPQTGIPLESFVRQR